MTNYDHRCQKKLHTAHQYAAGCYQSSLLYGTEKWSGAGLRGNAKKYLGRYADSRRGLLARLRKGGLLVLEVSLGVHGRRDVIIAADGTEMHALALACLGADVATLKSPAARARRLGAHVDALTRALGGSAPQIIAEFAAASPLSADERWRLVVDATTRMELTHHQRLAMFTKFKRLVGDGEWAT